MKIFVLMIFMFLPSCALICPQPKQALLPDQQSFGLAFDVFQKTHRLDGLRKFSTDFPDSAWVSRAETIILYSQELEQRKVQNEKLRASGRQQELEIEQLKLINHQLKEKIEQFKSLLIQSEQHPK